MYLSSIRSSGCFIDAKSSIPDINYPDTESYYQILIIQKVASSKNFSRQVIGSDVLVTGETRGAESGSWVAQP